MLLKIRVSWIKRGKSAPGQLIRRHGRRTSSEQRLAPLAAQEAAA